MDPITTGPADTRTTLLKQILVNIGGAADLGECPDNWIQILQAIVQTYGQSVSTTADTQQQLLIQWMEGVGFAYDSAIQTEVEALTQLYLFYGGSDDYTLPDHEIPLLRGIYEGSLTPPTSNWILKTNFWADSGVWEDTAVWQD